MTFTSFELLVFEHLEVETMTAMADGRVMDESVWADRMVDWAIDGSVWIEDGMVDTAIDGSVFEHKIECSM